MQSNIRCTWSLSDHGIKAKLHEKVQTLFQFYCIENAIRTASSSTWYKIQLKDFDIIQLHDLGFDIAQLHDLEIIK